MLFNDAAAGWTSPPGDIGDIADVSVSDCACASEGTGDNAGPDTGTGTGPVKTGPAAPAAGGSTSNPDLARGLRSGAAPWSRLLLLLRLRLMLRLRLRLQLLLRLLLRLRLREQFLLQLLLLLKLLLSLLRSWPRNRPLYWLRITTAKKAL